MTIKPCYFCNKDIDDYDMKVFNCPDCYIEMYYTGDKIDFIDFSVKTSLYFICSSFYTEITYLMKWDFKQFSGSGDEIFSLNQLFDINPQNVDYYINKFLNMKVFV